MCTNALKGTAPPYVELDCEIDDVVELFCAFPTALIPLVCAPSVFAVGVYKTEVVVALDPADCDPDAANGFVAPAPVAPPPPPEKSICRARSSRARRRIRLNVNACHIRRIELELRQRLENH